MTTKVGQSDIPGGLLPHSLAHSENRPGWHATSFHWLCLPSKKEILVRSRWPHQGRAPSFTRLGIVEIHVAHERWRTGTAVSSSPVRNIQRGEVPPPAWPARDLVDVDHQVDPFRSPAIKGDCRAWSEGVIHVNVDDYSYLKHAKAKFPYLAC